MTVPDLPDLFDPRVQAVAKAFNDAGYIIGRIPMAQVAVYALDAHAPESTITKLQAALNDAAQALHEGDDGGTRSETIADRIRAIQAERDSRRGVRPGRRSLDNA